MKRAVSTSITIEEAVAEMVNMDYIPAGLTLLEMIAAFQEEAEVEYENALIERLPEDQIAPLKIRMDSCQARHVLAKLLFESLQYEVYHPEKSMITLADDSSLHQRLTFDSVSDWASDRYGIGISRRTDVPNAVDEKLKNVRWKDVTIKIWKDHNIGYSFEKGDFKRSHFREIGLMNIKAKDKPKQCGGILIGLSKGERYPPTKKFCERNEKTAISRLRDVLCNWIKLSEDPFLPHNQSDGWKPKFKLKYDVNNADERAKDKAIHVSLDESMDDAYDTDE